MTTKITIGPDGKPKVEILTAKQLKEMVEGLKDKKGPLTADEYLAAAAKNMEIATGVKVTKVVNAKDAVEMHFDEAAPKKETTMTMTYSKGEMLPGTEAGSLYLVVGSRDGVKIGVRPLVFPWKMADLDPKRLFLCFGMRIRAVGLGVENASAMFNLPFKQKQKEEGEKYASVVVAVPVIALPASPAEIHKVVEEKLVVQALLGNLIARMGESVALIEPDLIVEFLNIGYENEVPQIAVKPAPAHELFIAD